MGLFTQRPQEPSAWAALPGEPLDPETGAERLTDAAPTLDPLGAPDTTVASINIPVTPLAEEPESDEKRADEKR